MKKFLTVLLVIAVMFTFSFSSAFAISADEAMAQALASAKESAIQALTNLVKLSDYDAVGQEEVKEIIAEGTDLINLQTDVAGVTSTLSTYQNKLINVKNANLNAVAAAQKAAKKSIADYIKVLEATGCYSVDIDAATGVADYATQINNQATVIGVELIKAQIYAAIEKVSMNVATDAETAKDLAEAKAAAIKVVKGEADSNESINGSTGTWTKWAKINADTATAKQVAAYKAKVADVVAAIKAATKEVTIYNILVREYAEVNALAAETEIEAAHDAVLEQVDAWKNAYAYDGYNGTSYNTLRDYTVAFGSHQYANNLWFAAGTVYTDGVARTDTTPVPAGVKKVEVKEMADVADAVAAVTKALETAATSSASLSGAKTAAVAKLANAFEIYDVSTAGDPLLATIDKINAEAAIDACASVEEVRAKTAELIAAWRTAYKAADTTYSTALKNANATLDGYLANFKAHGTLTGNTGSAPADYKVGALTEVIAWIKADIAADWNYDFGEDYADGTGTFTYSVHISGMIDLLSSSLTNITNAASYNAVVENVITFITGTNGLVDTHMAGFEVAADGTTFCAETKAAVKKATTVTEAWTAYEAGYEKAWSYTASAADAAAAKRLVRYNAYKAAVAAIEALPESYEVTLNDYAAVKAAYDAFVDDGVAGTYAFLEKFTAGTDELFINEAYYTDKIEDLAYMVGYKASPATSSTYDSTIVDLAQTLADFETWAYNNYLKLSVLTTYDADNQAALKAAYDAGVVAIKAAADTDYADDIANVVADAKTAMALAATTKVNAKAFAALVADAKAFLGTTYDSADYSAEGLAKIADIVATLDGAADREDVAKLTIAARKAIAAVNETLADQLVKDMEAKAYLQDLEIKARSVKTSKGVKVTIQADVQQLLDDGYTVEYKFYRSTKSNANFGTAKVTKTENTYLNTSGKKGTRYYYKAKLVVKNAAGEVVATSPLKQCLYATRVF